MSRRTPEPNDAAGQVRAGRLRYAVAVLLAVAAAARVDAQAQPAGPQVDTLDEVIVTGSRIKRAGFETLQPALVVGADAIADRAIVNVADALKEVPAFGVPGGSAVGQQSAVAVGQNFVNFFGLGSQRTLTLVDGRRFVAANTPAVGTGISPGLQVDLNTIPAALVERVETIAVGGAPVYGADAIAGTVNIIRKKDFQGFSGLVHGSTTEDGGGDRQRAQAVYGMNFNQDRGNLAVAVEYNKQHGLGANERAVTDQSLTFQGPTGPSPFQQVLAENSRVVLVNFSGLPLLNRAANFPNNFANAIKDAQGRPLQFAADGTLVPFNPGTPTGSPVFFSGGDGFSLADATGLLTDSERKLANLFVDYRLTDKLQLNVEGWYANNEATEVVNQPAFNESSFRTANETPSNVLQGPMALRLDNPFLPSASRAIIAANLRDANGDGNPDPNIDFDGNGVPETPGFWMAKGHQDLLRGSPSTGELTLYRGVVGLKGELPLGSRTFDWDVAYIYGRTVNESTNRVILSREFNLAIDAVRDPVTNQIRCRSTADPNCAPLNVFGDGAPSSAAAAYVTAPAHTETEIEQRVVSANATGKLFSLPGGDFAVALGAEYRRESSDFRPDFISSSGVARGAPLAPISGSFNSKEIYGELVVPIIGRHQDIPFADTLEFEGAARLVEHSTAGSDTTWTAGLAFAPVQDVKLRGNYTQSIRAPAVTEVFLPTAQVASFAQDPCDARFIGQGTNPARRAANCAAAGVPAGFQSIIVNASQLVSVEGNADLANEQANAWTAGVVLTPRFVPNLTLAVDWVDIELEDAIEQLNATVILQSCYDSADFPSAPVCQRFGRDAASQVVNLRTGFLNAGLVDFSGLTADLAYDLSLGGAGDLRFGLNYFYLDKLDFSVTGTDFNPAAGERNNSRNRATLNVVYTKGPVRALLQTQYTGPAVFDLTDGPNTRDLREIDEFWLFNAGVTYDWSENVSLQLNVDNVLDEDPPFGSMVGTLGGGANPATSTYFPGILGRSFALTARVSF